MMAVMLALALGLPVTAQERTVNNSGSDNIETTLHTSGAYSNINSSINTVETTITTLENKIAEARQRLDNAVNNNCSSGQYITGMTDDNRPICAATPSWVSISAGECGGACTAANTWSRANYLNGAADSLCQRHGKSKSTQYRTATGGYTSGSFCWWAGGTRWNCDTSCSSCYGLPRYTAVLCQ